MTIQSEVHNYSPSYLYLLSTVASLLLLTDTKDAPASGLYSCYPPLPRTFSPQHLHRWLLVSFRLFVTCQEEFPDHLYEKHPTS